MLENIGDKLLHYILLRKGQEYVYDIREEFDIESYDYTVAAAHDGNSASIISGGPRTFVTGNRVGDIPLSQNLDFSLGITAFDTNWAGRLPAGSYSGDYVVDFARFYSFSGDELNSTPQWQDEFNEGYLDGSKWFAADWTFADTQFTPSNVRFENGYMILRVEREESDGQFGGTNLALLGEAVQSSTTHGGVASRAIDGNTNGSWRKGSVTHTSSTSNSYWEVSLAELSHINQIVIYNRTDGCCINRLSDFSVSVLDEDDNVVWTQFYTESPEPMLTIDLNATGKKVRVNLDGILSLAEVQVYGN